MQQIQRLNSLFGVKHRITYVDVSKTIYSKWRNYHKIKAHQYSDKVHLTIYPSKYQHEYIASSYYESIARILNQNNLSFSVLTYIDQIDFFDIENPIHIEFRIPQICESEFNCS